MTPRISKRGEKVMFSPIRKYMPLMDEAEKRGVHVYRLNTGDPDILPPPAFHKGIKAHAKGNLKYAPSTGIPEHVEAWIEYYKKLGVSLEPKNIIPTVGCAEAILFAMQAAADPGDEIIVFEPVYVSYKSFSVMTGIKLVPVLLDLEKNFALPPVSEIEKKITKKTRAIVVVNPDNPTGKLWSEKELSSIVGLAKKHGLFIIADETYREIRFSGKPHTLLSEKSASEHVIVTDSASKRFSLPGARVGAVVSLNDSVMQAVLKFAQARLSVGTLEQKALIPLLREAHTLTVSLKKEYLKRRDAVYAALSAIPGVKCSKPEGAFYIYARLPVESAEEFVKFLIKDFNYKGETVAVSPMADFYITPGLGKNEIRIAYVLSVPKLKRAMEILACALAAYNNR
ncbi:MAG: pyridoxal phosphate-dependent aminotransferase [Candidatus Liptonbacteria bacterium]|nr:pyridoxal phosphate-dependent aminotransferase [Candidatus Liptonbacteria bacterium]